MTTELANRIHAKKASRSYSTSWLAIMSTNGIAGALIILLAWGRTICVKWEVVGVGATVCVEAVPTLTGAQVIGLLTVLATVVYGVSAGGAHATNIMQERHGERPAENR